MASGHNIQDVTGSETGAASYEFERTTGCGYTCCHPRSKCYRFIGLFFMCFLGFGSYFCFDNPSALQDYFIQDLNITTTQFSLFYSLYSWPTVVLCVVGGVLLDSVFGIRLGTNIYMAITLIGQIVFASGVFFNVFWVMCLGRFIFGIGAEPLAVAQNSYAVMWFKGKELNMVFGLQLSFARVGSAVNFWIMEPIYKQVNTEYETYQCLGVVLFLAGTTCVLSMVCSLILGCLDKKADRVLRRSENETAESIKLKDVKDFQASFWLISIICVSYYVAIFPFIAMGKMFFMSKFHMSAQDANVVNSVVYLISAFGSPALGLIVDKTGRNVLWVMLSIGCTIAAHCILNFTLLNPYIGMAFMGCAYSLLASGLWPLVALIIPVNQLGTAYGFCQSIQNLGLALATIISGIILDKYDYYWLEIFFIGSLAVALVTSFAMWIVDASTNGTLNMTPMQRMKHQQNALASEILEREKLLSSSSVTPHDLLQPNSEFHIRNRYLSRIGAPLPSNYDVNMKGLAYRALR